MRYMLYPFLAAIVLAWCALLALLGILIDDDQERTLEDYRA